jgi:hypothetical protein
MTMTLIIKKKTLHLPDGKDSKTSDNKNNNKVKEADEDDKY